MTFHDQYGLRPVINGAGPLTVLGGAPVSQEVISEVVRVLPEFVEIRDLQRRASQVIAEATGAEAGCVTACAAAGIAVAIAACMTGDDLAKIQKLPDTSGMPDQVIIQKGHVLKFEARVDQLIRMTGARVVEVGTVRDCASWEMEAAINDRTAAVLYVISHALHDLGGLMPLPAVVEVAHRHGIPVIVDAASEYQLKCFIADGADLVIYSAHKAFGGLTAGIIAGRKDLVRACYLQWKGFARTMKVGKEGIVGVMAALRRYQRLNREKIVEEEMGRLRLMAGALEDLEGLRPSIVPDPTGNPVYRLRVDVDPEKACLTAWELAGKLRKGFPPIRVRDWNAPAGYLVIDPTYLSRDDAALVAQRIRSSVIQAQREGRKPLPMSYSLSDGENEEDRSWPDV